MKRPISPLHKATPTRLALRLSRRIAVAATAMLALALASCDTQIDEDDRLVEQSDTVNLKDGKNVLVVDFTGQRCVNCPTANDEIHALQEAYGADRVVAVAMHSGPLGFRTRNGFLGLSTDEGDAYYNQWGIDHQPMGVIDYHGPYNYDLWPGLVIQQLKIVPLVSIQVSPTPQAEGSREFAGTVSMTSPRGAISARLQLWLTEDSISAFQMLPTGGRDLQYNHMHVYRAAVNGTDGQPVELDEEPTTVEYSFNADEAWNLNHLWMVAFVYDQDGVLQVVRKKL